MSRWLTTPNTVNSRGKRCLTPQAHELDQTGTCRGRRGSGVGIRDLERLLQSVFAACHPSRCQCVRSAFDGISLVPRLAAVATANPDICAHIPANQRVNEVAAPLRDWCFYTVAFYTQDIRVCDRMMLSAAEATVLAVKAAGVRPEIAEQMGLHAECARIAKRLGPRLHYGPEVPSDDHQTQPLNREPLLKAASDRATIERFRERDRSSPAPTGTGLVKFVRLGGQAAFAVA